MICFVIVYLIVVIIDIFLILPAKHKLTVKTHYQMETNQQESIGGLKYSIWDKPDQSDCGLLRTMLCCELL